MALYDAARIRAAFFVDGETEQNNGTGFAL